MTLRSAPCGRVGLEAGNSPAAMRSVQSANILIARGTSRRPILLAICTCACPDMMRRAHASSGFMLANSFGIVRVALLPPITATLKYRLALALMFALFVCFGVTAPRGDLRSGSRADESTAAKPSRAYPCTAHPPPQRRRARRDPPDPFFGPAPARAPAVPWV